MVRKKFRILYLALFLLSMLFAVAGCTGDISDGSSSNAIHSSWIEKGKEEVKTPTISLSTTHKELLIGEEMYLTVTGENVEGYTLTYRSDNEKIATVAKNGLVTAIGEGHTTITAEYWREGAESVTATCTISSSFGDYRPELRVYNTNDGVLAVAKGSSFQLNAGVEFNNKSFDDAELTYEVKNTSVIEIDKTGKITAKAIGETEIVIHCTWRGVSYRDVPELSVTVPVRVQVDIVYYNDGEPFDDLTLYTVKSFNGETYVTSVPCKFKVMIDGALYDADVHIADETIVMQSGVFLNALRIGETTLTVSCDNGTIQTSRTIAVNVIRPEMTIEEKVPTFCTYEGTWFDAADGSRKTIYDFIKANVADAEKYGTEIIEAYQDNKLVTINTDGRLIGVKSSAIQSRGEANLMICTDKVVYHLQMETLGNVINNFTDLEALATAGIREGYWELLNNLDATGKTIGGKGTFRGVFDGKGHTIKNLTIPENGSLLGNGGDSFGCTVKNIALVNLNATRAYYFFTESGGAEAGFVMDNVYIKLSEDTIHPRGLTGYAGNGNSYKNILIEYTGKNADTFRDYTEQTNYGVFIGDIPLTVPTQKENGVKREFSHDKTIEYNWEGIYVVSPYALAFNPVQVGWNSGGDGTYSATYAYAENKTTDVYGNPIVSEDYKKTGEYTRANPNLGDFWTSETYYNIQLNHVRQYTNQAEMTADLANCSFKGFNSAYWVLADGAIPVWKTANF